MPVPTIPAASAASLFALTLAACTTVPVVTPELATTEPTAPTPIPAQRDRASVDELPDHYEFAFVTLGKSWKTGFAEAVDKGGPALLAELWIEDSWPERLVPTIDRAFGTQEQRWDAGGEARAVALDAGQLSALGFTPPATPLWLIGPAGPCRVSFGEPLLAWYAWGPEVVELSWQLVIDDPRPGCELGDPEQWSQIAVFTDSLPQDLRFVNAQVNARARIELTSWVSPHAQLVREAVAETASDNGLRPDEVWVREVIVPDTELLELTVASIQRDRPAPGESPDLCADWQENAVLVGLQRQQLLTPFELALEEWALNHTELRGAFVRGAEVVWTVHESFSQPIIHTPTRETTKTVELEIAIFHEEDHGDGPFSQTEYCGP